jgi:hypothetical protein
MDFIGDIMKKFKLFLIVILAACLFPISAYADKFPSIWVDDQIRIYDTDWAGYYVGFQAGSMAGNTLYTLPVADGTNGQVLTTNGSLVLSWTTVSGAGDVAKVGTPVDNEIGVWTGDGTIEGDTNFQWNGSALTMLGTIFIKEQADAAADQASYGQIWVNTATPNELWFTDDAGTDVQLGTFLAADRSKLDGIEALADVTDTTNVTNAGALMDSEVDADLKTLALPANTTISAFGASLIDDAAASNARTTLGLVIGTDVLAEQTIGIANDNLLEVDDASAADNEYAKFTANGLEGRSYSEVRTDLGIGAGAEANTEVYAENLDVDTGTATVDSFADTTGASCFWDYVAINGANVRAGSIIVAWDASGDTVSTIAHRTTEDVGTTTGLVLSVDIDTNNVRLRATAGSDNWIVKAYRRTL